MDATLGRNLYSKASSVEMFRVVVIILLTLRNFDKISISMFEAASVVLSHSHMVCVNLSNDLRPQAGFGHFTYILLIDLLTTDLGPQVVHTKSRSTKWTKGTLFLIV